MNAFYLIGFIAVSILTIFYRRKALAYEELLVEASGKFELSRKQLQRTEEDNASKQLLYAQLKKDFDLKIKENKELDEKASKLTNDYNLKLNAIENQFNSLKTKHDELSFEYDSLKLNLNLLEKERNEILSKPAESLKETQELTQRIELLHLELEGLRTTSKNLSNELQEKTRKLAQSEHLYLSMKGLKEISEERAENWEHALSKITNYIIENKNTDHTITKLDGDKNKLSIRVALALELIGDSLDDVYNDNLPSETNQHAESI